MLKSIKGVYNNRKIELSEFPLDISESQVIVTFLEPKETEYQKEIMRFGMFYGNKKSTEKDF